MFLINIGIGVGISGLVGLFVFLAWKLRKNVWDNRRIQEEIDESVLVHEELQKLLSGRDYQDPSKNHIYKT